VIKPLLRNVAAVHSVEETEQDSAEYSESQHLRDELQVALAATHGPYRHESSGASPWSPGSSATSVASFPTRGWTSPGASVTSRYPVAPPGMMAQHSRNTPPGTGPNSQKPQLCYVCYQNGHWLTDCPALSPEARREASMNRERYLSGVQHCGDTAPRPPRLEAR
jgi:hypothetical protein